MRRGFFLRAGGFCPLFHPGYWEDYDISALALRAGFRNWYAPMAVSRHIGQHSMRRRFGESVPQSLIGGHTANHCHLAALLDFGRVKEFVNQHIHHGLLK